ncbi:MAG TPA: O-antigen ligase family protein [Puia sp.]|jgi:O-antigen ligase
MRSILLLDPTAKIFSLREKALYFLLAAFFISLGLPDMPVVQNVVIGGIVVLSLFYNPFREKARLLKDRKEIVLMLLFFLMHIVSVFFSVNRDEAMKMLALRAPLLVFPLTIGLLYIRNGLKERILLAFSIIITLISVACLVYAIHRYRQFNDTGHLYDDSLTLLIHMQSIYFAMFVNMALFSYIYLLRKKSFAIEYIGLAYLSIAFLLVFHFMLASRIAIIILYSVFLVYGMIYIVRRRKYLEGSVVILGLIIGAVLLVKFFPKTMNRFNELNYPGYQFNNHGVESHYNMDLTADQWNGANIRLAVWKCGRELAAKYWLLGAQLGDKQDRLTDVYRSKGFDFAIDTHRNMHNNYLDIFCTFGVIGFLIFLLGYLVIPLRKAIREPDTLAVIILLSLAVAMLTETYMDRTIGCLMLGFFLSFISAAQDPKTA